MVVDRRCSAVQCDAVAVAVGAMRWVRLDLQLVVTAADVRARGPFEDATNGPPRAHTHTTHTHTANSEQAHAQGQIDCRSLAYRIRRHCTQPRCSSTRRCPRRRLPLPPSPSMSKPRGPVPNAAAKGNNLRGRAAGPAPSSSSVASSASSAASAGAAARRPAVRDGASDGAQQQGLKIVNGDQELSILDNKVTIGRRKECDICLSGHSTRREQQEGRDCSRLSALHREACSRDECFCIDAVTGARVHTGVRWPWSDRRTIAVVRVLICSSAVVSTVHCWRAQTIRWSPAITVKSPTALCLTMAAPTALRSTMHRSKST